MSQKATRTPEMILLAVVFIIGWACVVGVVGDGHAAFRWVGVFLQTSAVSLFYLGLILR